MAYPTPQFRLDPTVDALDSGGAQADNNEAVASWKSGDYAFAATGATYKSTGMDGYPCVSLASSGSLENTDIPAYTGDFTVLMVSKADPAAGVEAYGFGGRSTSTSVWALFTEKWNNTGHMGLTAYGGNPAESDTGIHIANEIDICVVRFSGTTATVRRNNTVWSATVTRTSPNLNGLVINGFRRSNTVNSSFARLVGDVIGWNSALTDAELDEVITEMISKYELNIEPLDPLALDVARIGTSGEVLATRWLDSTSDPVTAPVVSTSGTVSIKVNAGSAITLTRRISIPPWVFFVIPEADRPEAGDTVTMSMTTGIVSQAREYNAAITDQAITNSTGTETLPAVADLPDRPDRTDIWYNLTNLTYWVGNRWYQNDARQIDFWIEPASNLRISLDDVGTNGLPTIPARAYFWWTWNSADGNRSPGGDVVVRWKDSAGESGTSVVGLSGATPLDSGAITWDAVRGMKRRRYNLSANHGGDYLAVTDATGLLGPIEVTLEAEEDRLVTHTLTDRSIERLAGIKGIRLNNFLLTNGSNVCNVTDLAPDDYQLTTKGTYRDVAISAIATTTDTILGTIQGTILNITTSSAHGLEQGRLVYLSGTGGTLGGGSIDDYSMVARVTSTTEFKVRHWRTGALAYTSGGTAAVYTQSGPAPEMIARAANDLPDLEYVWATVPHLMTDACFAAWVTRFFAVVRDGVYLLIEYGNETWNYAASFYVAYDYCRIKAADLSLANSGQWSATRTEEFRVIAEAIAPGRIKTVLSGQYANVAVLTQKADYAVAEEYVVDYYSYANYFTVSSYADAPYLGPSGNIDVIAAKFDADKPDAYIAAHQALATRDSKPVLIYEGHQHNVAGSDATLQTLYKQIDLHPRMVNLTWAWMIHDFVPYDIDAMTWFELFQKWTMRFGSWGAYQGWDEDASIGDGSDGKTDNRVAYSTVTSVSVKGYAATTWMTSVNAPTSFTATASDSSVDLEWDDPSDENIGWFLAIDDGDAVEITSSVTIAAGKVSYTVGGLANGTEYTFALYAYDWSIEIASDTVSDTATPADTTAPNLSIYLDGYRAVIPDTGDRINLVFNEAVTGVSAADFSATADAEAITISGQSGSGTSWSLTLAAKVTATPVVLLSYAGTGTEDAAGNNLAAFTNATVRNESEVEEPVPSKRPLRGRGRTLVSLRGRYSTGNILRGTFMETLDRNYSYSPLLSDDGTDTDAFAAPTSLTAAELAAAEGVLSFVGKDFVPRFLRLTVKGLRSSADNEAAKIRIFARRLDKATGKYLPETLLTLTATLGTLENGTSSDGSAPAYMADTLAVVAEESYLDESQYQIVSPADNTVASIVLDMQGSSAIEIQAIVDTCTYVNVLAAYI